VETTLLPIDDIERFKQQALLWANQFPVCCLLDNNNYSNNKHQSTEWKLAVDALDSISENAGNAFEKLKAFQAGKTNDIFGFFSYELKNEIEQIHTRNPDKLGFPHLYFFQPRFVLAIEQNRVRINRNYPEAFNIVEQILNFKPLSKVSTGASLKLRTSREDYLNNVRIIKQKIVDGDFYEMNYCIEEFDDDASINPVYVFHKLNSIAKAPFSSFFKLNDKFLLCASPERFLKKEGTKLISQPIKGTVKKGASDAENELLKKQLQQNEKERAENVMIVDLVRNDLARSSKPGSVKVEELCGIYEFETVHQMISTVTAEMRNDVHFTDAIRNAFPMGSMTGAPKVEVMKTIDEMEDFQRGLYSGSVAYVSPQGDFDLNVVIRSIFYNSTNKYLSLRAGSAITFDSNDEAEWNEVMLKLQALKRSLEVEVKGRGTEDEGRQ